MYVNYDVIIYSTGILPSHVMYFTYNCPENEKSGEVILKMQRVIKT